VVSRKVVGAVQRVRGPNLDPETARAAVTAATPSRKEKSEESLMAAYARGDKEAFTELFERLAPRVHAFFMRSFRSRALADDLMQTTFLKIHRARESYHPEEPLRPWVFTIAARIRIDELRKRYRLPEDASEDAIEKLETAQTPAPSPLERLEDATRDSTVRQALDRLPETQRVVIHLHRFEGLSFAEIGRLLGASEGAVRVRAFRGYESLRVSLEHLVGEAD
jgi:RNA polymerase sigma-70 factor, ECF subfamily